MSYIGEGVIIKARSVLNDTKEYLTTPALKSKVIQAVPVQNPKKSFLGVTKGKSHFFVGHPVCSNKGTRYLRIREYSQKTYVRIRKKMNTANIFESMFVIFLSNIFANTTNIFNKIILFFKWKWYNWKQTFLKF